MRKVIKATSLLILLLTYSVSANAYCIKDTLWDVIWHPSTTKDSIISIENKTASLCKLVEFNLKNGVNVSNTSRYDSIPPKSENALGGMMYIQGWSACSSQNNNPNGNVNLIFTYDCGGKQFRVSHNVKASPRSFMASMQADTQIVDINPKLKYSIDVNDTNSNPLTTSVTAKIIIMDAK